MSMKDAKLILASASPRRLELLKQISVIPDKVIAPEIDETPLKKEKPKDLALRLAIKKAEFIHAQNPDCFVLAADTVVGCGQQILDKANDENYAFQCLKKLSGRRHHVYGGICLISPQGKIQSKLCDSLVQFKPLTQAEITTYIASKEWHGKAGGYAIQGLASTYIKYMSGSYSNVVGLSLYDIMKMLQTAGYLRVGE